MMKPNSMAVLGLQWGDEGKGKVIDFLSERCDAVARFSGGANAGHTIVVNGQKFILKLLPSGVLHEGKICLIGSGVALDLWILKTEIEELAEKGISVDGRLFIDFASHLVLPLHKIADGYQESLRGKNAIDTTKRGIGPSYADRVSRVGLRVADLYDKGRLDEKIDYIFTRHEECLEKAGDEHLKDRKILKTALDEMGELFKPFVTDVAGRVMELVSGGKKVLYEGAQGMLLDVDLGTYPYVTSSHTTIGGLFTGLGIPPSYVGEVIGITKAYMTRVGHGPFVSEINGDLAEELRESGGEYGSVTGRPRRVGWLDLVALKRAIRANGINKLAVTKLDVLDRFTDLYVCESYELNGELANGIPPNHPEFALAKAKLKKIPGWDTPTAGINRIDKLPENARRYIEYISERTGVPVWMVSTGSSRESTIVVEN
jgi:adenylosuccinate synthase